MEINDVKDALRIRQLPLNGRDVRNLFNLTPGVEGGGVPRVNGMKVGSAEVVLDGISLIDRFGGGLRGGVSPGLDMIQEYRIETVGSNASNSRPATVTLVTKSGTNEFHGAAFETHRNNFGGLRARARQDGNTTAQLIRNEFGVSAGGPIFRNKTFWFASYEGNRLRQASFARAAVPTPEMWAGDFSMLTDTNSNRILDLRSPEQRCRRHSHSLCEQPHTNGPDHFVRQDHAKRFTGPRRSHRRPESVPRS